MGDALHVLPIGVKGKEEGLASGWSEAKVSMLIRSVGAAISGEKGGEEKKKTSEDKKTKERERKERIKNKIK